MPAPSENSENQRSVDERYILRCIQLGMNAQGSAAPNPMVGSVVVHHGRIIGEGYTSPYGGPHAEVNAIASVNDLSLLPESTLYVTLEPCSHFGKTPPCTDLIIKNNIPQVVIGTMDPHSKVSGSGIKRLKEAGCTVTTGVMEAQCREHHRRFLSYHEKKRPYIILKWGETQDGFMAPEPDKRMKEPQPYWITQTGARQLTHQWRSEEQAILAGTNTILMDNPALTTRLWKGASPLRVILDQNLKIPAHFQVMDGQNKTLVLTGSSMVANGDGTAYEQLNFSGDIARQVAGVLYRQQVISVLVEGGAKTIRMFIEADLWDEARIFTGNTTFKRGLKAPALTGRITQQTSIGPDHLKIIRHD
jgi:diaminohydroxyphosphoribosylaminopyrimidine deaminase/5-amino-6-(5-phosphoribosylamino)uracil reductase